jgi:hypothetical protein
MFSKTSFIACAYEMERKFSCFLRFVFLDLQSTCQIACSQTEISSVSNFLVGAASRALVRFLAWKTCSYESRIKHRNFSKKLMRRNIDRVCMYACACNLQYSTCTIRVSIRILEDL